MQQRLELFAVQFKPTSAIPSQEPFAFQQVGNLLELININAEFVSAVVQTFLEIWPDVVAQFKLQLSAENQAYLVRQKELEEERKANLARQKQLAWENRPEWQKRLEQMHSLEKRAACPTLLSTVVLPKEWPEYLSKEQLGAFLTFLKLPASSRELKANLVEHLKTHMANDEAVKSLLFEIFAHELAVAPWELEKLLNCTTPERKRWTEEEKLHVLGTGNFRKHGQDLDYPYYDRRDILTLTINDLEAWRAEHKVAVHERRKAGAKVAAITRKARQDAEEREHMAEYTDADIL
jgi:hypothetical protein